MNYLSTLLLALAAALFTACGDSKEDSGPSTEPSLGVSTNQITLGNTKGAYADFALTANTSWTATAVTSGAGFLPSALDGKGSTTIRVAALAANDTAAEIDLGTITFAASGAIPQTVRIRQSGKGSTPPPAGNLTLTLDFAAGASIASPVLPSYPNGVTGRATYTMQGYPFAVFADADQKGKYYWIDNSQFNPGLPAPTKALYFSKLGACVEFPAIADKVLTKVVFTRSSNGAGDIDLEITDTDGVMANHGKEDLADGSGWTFTLYTPEVNTAYRLTLINSKNAQAAKLVLTYTAEE